MTFNKEDILIVALVGLGAYLKSPVVCVSAVVLFGLQYAYMVLASKGKDSEIADLTARLEGYEKRFKVLEADVVNVAERAKNVLGEHY